MDTPSRALILQNFPQFLCSPQLFSAQFSFSFFQTPRNKKTKLIPKALKQWREYDDAVKRKDLARALKFLKSVEMDKTKDDSAESVSNESPQSGISDLGFFDGSRRNWEVLDACLNADDMRLVGSAYVFLKNRGLLPNFGKFSNVGNLTSSLVFILGQDYEIYFPLAVLEGPRDVTPTVFESSTGLEVSKFAPKKWGVSGASTFTMFAFLGGASYLLWQGIDIRPNLSVILGLAFLDSVFLGGTCLAQISSYWPPHRRRILVHEAGHLLVAYLMGCPIRGVILDPIVAMQMGIQGQAGTQFWDEKMSTELAEGRLSGTSFDRYCMVLFAGIAAEALVYGEAEGGENDENLFKSISVLLQPPLSVAQMSNQARWSVLQSYNLLKWQKKAHRAAVKALESGGSLSVVIRDIERAMSSR